jgi:hypothetical protein
MILLILTIRLFPLSHTAKNYWVNCHSEPIFAANCCHEFMRRCGSNEIWQTFFSVTTKQLKSQSHFSCYRISVSCKVFFYEKQSNSMKTAHFYILRAFAFQCCRINIIPLTTLFLILTIKKLPQDCQYFDFIWLKDKCRTYPSQPVLSAKAKGSAILEGVRKRVQVTVARVHRGRCHNHNFLRFVTIFGEKNSLFFAKKNVTLKFLHN